jgi:four helix bundle protein
LRPDAQVVEEQVLRSATSVAANYKTSQRARSHAEFIAKIGIIVEEAGETVFWLEILADAEIASGNRIRPLCNGAKELVAIYAATQKTIREHYGKHRPF